MSNSRRRRRRGPVKCWLFRKDRFRTEAAAIRMIRYMIESGRAAQHPRAGDRLNAYPCWACKGWHWGHTKHPESGLQAG